MSTGAEIKKEKALFHLGLPDCDRKILLDFDKDGRVGAALLIPKDYTMVEWSQKGDGVCVWASVLTEVGEINIGSIYAPN